MTRAEALSGDQARRLALQAQGLLTAAPSRLPGAGVRARANAVDAVLDRLGAVQLDTISVLARSHELVPYARLGPVGRDAVERSYWHHRPGQARVFEYWSHAASLLPAAEWPTFAFRRRSFRARGRRWHDVDEATVASVLTRLESDGPLTSTELGGARRGGEWWDWSDVKVAVEWLLDIGEVVVSERRAWRRVYDLPARALPAAVVDAADPGDDACVVRLVGLAGTQLGIGTEADLADQYRLTRAQVRAALPDTALVPVAVEGWRDRAWADAAALEQLGRRGRHRTTLLSPFDSLVWDRKRTARMFGLDHRLEAYTPAPKRVHGYFAMPVLHRGRLVARVDPAREGTTLVAKRVTVEEPATSGANHEDALRGTALALREAASWVGCTDVRVDDVRGPAAPDELRVALREV